MTTLVVSNTVPAFSQSVQQFIDNYANSAHPGYEDASRAAAERMFGQFFDYVAEGAYGNTPMDRAEVERNYMQGGSSGSSSPTPAPAPGQPAVVAPTPVITPNQAAQIQAAQQKALAANPTADPATIYLQTLQANGYTLDATGKIVKLP